MSLEYPCISPLEKHDARVGHILKVPGQNIALGHLPECFNLHVFHFMYMCQKKKKNAP